MKTEKRSIHPGWFAMLMLAFLTAPVGAAVENYTVVLKLDTDTPCATYVFSVDYADAAATLNPDPQITTDFPVDLTRTAVFAACDGEPNTAFPGSTSAFAQLATFGQTEKTTPGGPSGPSRVRSLTASGALGLATNGQWSASPYQGPEYFVYNVNAVPSPAVAALLLTGVAGMAAAVRLRRKNR